MYLAGRCVCYATAQYEIEIENWDTQPCGGTHCRGTGEVGLIKIKKWEKVSGGVRIHFICGVRAFADYQRKLRDLVEAGRRRNSGEDEILETLERAAAERDRLRKELKRLNATLTQARAIELARVHLEKGGGLLVHREKGSDPESLRLLAGKLIDEDSKKTALFLSS